MTATITTNGKNEISAEPKTAGQTASPPHDKGALTKNEMAQIMFFADARKGMSGRCNMRRCMDAENLHRRLKKIIGQVQAIDRMVDEDVPCEDVLAQINAAKSALHKAGQVVLEGHIKHCVRDGIEHGDADQTIASFTKAVERFANMD